MLVSINSLRKHYDGNITVFLIAEQPEWFLEMLDILNCDTIELEANGVKPLVRKAKLWRDSPYDLTLFIDADTVIVAPIDEYFDKIREHKFCTGEFAEWKTTGGTMKRRIRSFQSIVPDYVKPAIAYGKATNTGIFGFTKDAPILEEWEWITEKGQKVNRIPDEVGCQLLLHKYHHWLAPVQWGVSVKMSQDHHHEDMKIIHYHGRKHVSEWELCEIWKQEYWDLRNNHPAYEEELGQAMGDRRFARYINEINSKDVTIVTAVNPKYLPKLKANYSLWMKTAGVMEYPMILFVHDIDPESPELDFLNENVQVIPWDMEGADSERELMLTSFVLGTAKHVTTKWWIKLDADTTPKEGVDKKYGYHLGFPEDSWKDNAFTGHKWGYTKPGKYLLMLEDWADEKEEFRDTKRIFPPEEKETMERVKRYGHPRIASYVCLQSLEFTQLCAELAGPKLPVPSHDTYMWYVAARLGYPIIRHNFKKRFQP
jgi:hypothetical protein